MTLTCAPIDQSQALAERLAGYVDCHAQALGQAGFADLSTGWLGPALLGGCLTIYVALIGYRLLLGLPFGARDAILAVLRIGVVIAFVSNWPAYETVIYRVVIDGPSELAGQFLSPAGLAPSSLPDIARKVDADFATLEAQQAGPAPAPSQLAGSPQGPLGQSAAPPAAQAIQPQGERDPIETRAGPYLVVSAIGGLAMVRLACGLLLALGPFIITLALFEVGVGLFEGWVRALFGAMLASVGCAIVAALLLDFFESQIMSGGLGDPATQLGPAALVTISLVFGGITIGVIFAAFVVSRGLRLPRQLNLPVVGWLPPAFATSGTQMVRPRGSDQGQETISRSHTISDAITRLGERERGRGLQAQPYFRFARAEPGGSVVAGSTNSSEASRPPSRPASRRPVTPPRTASAQRRNSRP